MYEDDKKKKCMSGALECELFPDWVLFALDIRQGASEPSLPLQGAATIHAPRDVRFDSCINMSLGNRQARRQAYA